MQLTFSQSSIDSPSARWIWWSKIFNVLERTSIGTIWSKFFDRIDMMSFTSALRSAWDNGIHSASSRSSEIISALPHMSSNVSQKLAIAASEKRQHSQLPYIINRKTNQANRLPLPTPSPNKKRRERKRQ